MFRPSPAHRVDSRFAASDHLYFQTLNICAFMPTIESIAAAGQPVSPLFSIAEEKRRDILYAGLLERGKWHGPADRHGGEADARGQHAV